MACNEDCILVDREAGYILRKVEMSTVECMVLCRLDKVVDTLVDT